MAAADPIGDGYLANRDGISFLVVQELFLTETARAADVVLPAQSWAEREGTFTNGERRVQRFYMAIPGVGQSRADWQILAQVGEQLGMGKPKVAPSLVFNEIAKQAPEYAGMNYKTLAQVEEQWPKVGGEDLYYGGTSYENGSGLGQQWAVAAESGAVATFEVPEISRTPVDLQVIRITALYQPGTLVNKSEVIAGRVPQPVVWVNPDNQSELAIGDGESIALRVNDQTIVARTRVNEDVAAGIVAVRGMPYQHGEIEVVAGEAVA